MCSRPALAAEEALSELLRAWFHWQRSYGSTTGYPRRAAGCEDWNASRQYDSENGALDAAVDHSIMEIVEFEATELQEPARTAIHVNARALALGLSVFRSPRLPTDQVACLRIIADARTELARRLKLRGVA